MNKRQARKIAALYLAQVTNHLDATELVDDDEAHLIVAELEKIAHSLAGRYQTQLWEIPLVLSEIVEAVKQGDL